MSSNWFIPWHEIESSEGVTLERQMLGQYRVRVYSDLTEHHTYYFHSAKDAMNCYDRAKDSIKFEKSFFSKDL